MAAGYSVTIACKICGDTLTAITGTLEAAGAGWDALKLNRNIQCKGCGQQLKFHLSNVTVQHDDNVGANTTITNVVANGTIGTTTVS